MKQEFDSQGRPHPLRKALVPILIGMAFLLRLAVFAINVHRAEPRFLQPDSFTYLYTADSLTQQGAILDCAGHPTWGRVPAYPVILAGFFRAGLASSEHPQAVILLQVLLGSLVAFLAAKIAGGLGGAGTAAAAAALLVLEPSSIAYSNVLLTEIPYTVGLLLAVIAWRGWLGRPDVISLTVLSLSLGILPLFRPIALYLPLALLPLLLGSLRRISAGRFVLSIFLFLFLSFLPSLAWTLRNLSVLGSARLHYTGPWAQAVFSHDVEKKLGIDSEPARGFWSQPWDYDFGKERKLPESLVSRIRSEYFARTVRAHPLASFRVFLANGLGIVTVPDSLLSELILDTPLPIEGGSVLARFRWLVGQGFLLGFLLVLGVAVSLGGTAALAWLIGRPPFADPIRKSVLGFLEVVVVYHVVLSSLVGHQGERYRVPIIPALAILLLLAIRSVRTPGRIARLLGTGRVTG